MGLFGSNSGVQNFLRLLLLRQGFRCLFSDAVTMSDTGVFNV